MLHTRRDWLLDQLQELAEALLAHLAGAKLADPIDEAQLLGATGLSGVAAERLSLGTLRLLLTGVDGRFDGPRALSVGLVLARRGADAGEPQLQQKGLALLDAAIAADPTLEDPSLRELRRALRA
ncbi:MAG: hypothetical protein JXX28_09250 [Deltaproteobacteria bacterium]|nr:hypothetical protein [Deltaproteobacteria bacterium]